LARSAPPQSFLKALGRRFRGVSQGRILDSPFVDSRSDLKHRAPDARYLPPVCIGCDLEVVSGDPDPKHGTWFVERQNLTMRMGSAASLG